LIQVELEALGIKTAYNQQRVAELGDEVWQGVRNKYWHFPVYFLPVCTKVAVAAAAAEEDEEAGTNEQQNS
jgi:protein arginine N-methyltransferase 2